MRPNAAWLAALPLALSFAMPLADPSAQTKPDFSGRWTSVPEPAPAAPDAGGDGAARYPADRGDVPECGCRWDGGQAVGAPSPVAEAGFPGILGP